MLNAECSIQRAFILPRSALSVQRDRKDTIKALLDVATSFDNCCQVYVKYVNLIVTSSTYETARLRPAHAALPGRAPEVPSDLHS